MSTRITVCLLMFAASCSTDTTSTASRTTPPAHSPSVESKPVPMPSKLSIDASVKQWSVSFVDGNGNRYRIKSEDDHSEGHLIYSPITADVSSTGMYSGGDPADITIRSKDNTEVWESLRALRDDTSVHTDKRTMGSGTFRITDSNGTTSFLVRRGKALLDFTAFMRSLHEQK